MMSYCPLLGKWPRDLYFPIDPEFVRRALASVEYLGTLLSDLSEHDRVIVTRLDCYDLSRSAFFFRQVTMHEAYLLDQIACGRGVHTTFPDWVI